MSTRNDIARNASLFTMNGLVDPRMIPHTAAHKTTSRPENPNPDVLGVWALVQRLFGRMSKGNAGL